MDFITCLLLTLISTVLCITLPKFLSLMLAAKAKRTAPAQPTLTLQTENS